MLTKSIAPAILALAMAIAAVPAFAQAPSTVLTVRGPTTPAGPVIIEGAGEKMDRASVDALFTGVDAATRRALAEQPDRASDQIALSLVTQALYREAIAKGVQNRPEVRARAERAAQAEIAQAYLEDVTQPQLGAFPAETDLKSVYDANPRAFLRPQEVQLAQFAVPLAAGADAATVEAARKKISDLRTRAAASAESFAVVTLDNNGSQLGWIRVADLQPEVRTVVENATAGTVTQPIRVENGFVVLRVQARRGGDPLPYADAKELLRPRLRAERLNQLRQQALGERLEKAPLSVKDPAAFKAAIQGGAR